MTRRRAPINQLFDRIDARLLAFVESRRTALWWVVADEERPWIDAGLKKTRVAKVVALTSPLDDRATFGHVLAAELVGKLSGAGGPWAPPPGAARLGGALGLAAIAESFARQVTTPAGKALVLRVEPGGAPPPEALVGWVADALHAFAPTGVRLLVLDDGRSRDFERLSNEPAVVCARAALNVDEAIESLAAAQGDATPEPRIRLLLLRCMHASRRGDVAAAVASGEDAVRTASAHGLYALAVPACFAVGAAWLGQRNPAEAVRAYRTGEQLATLALERGHDGAAELRVFARLGVGSALFAGEGYAQAAPFLLETAPLAAAVPNLRLEVESYRLAAYALEQLREHARAWEAAVAGLGAIARAPAEARPRDSGRELGELMLRLVRTRELEPYRDGLDAQLERHLGRDWRSAPPAPVVAS